MTDQEREHLAELKTFTWAAPMILPLIRKRRDIAFQLLMQDFKAGKTDNIARIAELNVLSDLEREINQKELEYQTLEKQNDNRK